MWKCPKCGRSFKRQNQSHYCIQVPVTIDEYILSQPEAIRPYLNQIRDTLREALPEAEEKISWGMPTYWAGRNIIHFAAARKHIGLYPGEEAVKMFSEQLAAYTTGKGTIQLQYNQLLPLELIAEIAKWSCETDEID